MQRSTLFSLIPCLIEYHGSPGLCTARWLAMPAALLTGLLRAPFSSGWPSRVFHHDLGLVFQLVYAAAHYTVTRLQPAGNRSLLAVVIPDRHRPHDHNVAFFCGLDQVNECALVVMLYCIDRHHAGVTQGFTVQTDVYKLVGKQVVIEIGKFGLEFQRARCGINLVIDAFKHALGQQLCVGFIPGFDHRRVNTT